MEKATVSLYPRGGLFNLGEERYLVTRGVTERVTKRYPNKRKWTTRSEGIKRVYFFCCAIRSCQVDRETDRITQDRDGMKEGVIDCWKPDSGGLRRPSESEYITSWFG